MDAGRFETTQWSLVMAAGEDRSRPEDALAALCQTYWYPLYAFVRRKGYQPAEAQDLTQGFFASLLEKKYLADADPERGRFRSFLLAALKHYITDAKKHQAAKKRGGDRLVLSLDLEVAERSYLAEPQHSETAEVLFERQWAVTLLDRVLARLRQEYAEADKTKQFEELKGVLTSSAGPDSHYRSIGERLDMTENAVKVVVHRMRQRYRELLKEEIAETVSSPEEMQEEVRTLFNSVRR